MTTENASFHDESTDDDLMDNAELAAADTRRTLSRERRNRRRDHWLIAGCAVVALGSAAALGARIAGAAAPVPTVTRATVAATHQSGAFSLLLGGDTMLADGAVGLMSKKGVDAPLARLKPVIASADYTLLNSESPISDEYAANARPGAKYVYNSAPAVAGVFARAGVDALALNNNHLLDRTETGLADTLAFAAQNGLETVGAGVNEEAAERPLLVDSPQGTMGIVNLGENFGPLSRADVDKAGMIAFSPASVQRGIDLARAAGADHVIAFVHWGDNYSEVNDQQRHWAQMFADAGYEAVIGAGSHTAQPVEVVSGIPVYYGLGNFAFGSPGRFSDFGKQGFGLTARVVMTAQGLEHRVGCLATDNEDETVAYQARPCTTIETSAAFESLLPAGYTMVGSEARLTVA